jgi:competence protein ComEC
MKSTCQSLFFHIQICLKQHGFRHWLVYFFIMPAGTFYFWTKAPFTRLFLPFAAGIILQWYQPTGITHIWMLLSGSIFIIASFFFIPFFTRYKWGMINGIAIFVLFVAAGMLLTQHRNVRNKDNWLGHLYKEHDAVVAILDEPLIEKTRSFKANATIIYLQHDDSCTAATGKIILYFKKDSCINLLTYGSMIIFRKSLQEIYNAGNPGGFDYKRYCLFQGITHQVYLKQDEFELLPGKKTNSVQQFIYNSREWVLRSLRRNISGEKELGLAEALLIGYKNDLDKELVQSYSNTGVVHVIAISGLHLGLIYALLVLLCKPMQRRKNLKWLRLLLIIAGLWLFSLLAGAQPSVLRSALMFSCIVLGESLDRKTSIFNTLACSAFILLCINPYWLWDVGFQLSYAAVLSIVIFMRPIYNWFYFKNKLADLAWKLNAVTLSAQVLTLPLCIYHFHQFPNYFLLTNFVAVPLSSLILIIEIILCVLSFIPAIALLIGKLLALLILLMNTCVEWVEAIPFSVWTGLQISLVQAIALFLFIGFSSYWLLERSTKALISGLLALLVFGSLRSYSFIGAARQQKIIVYNISQKQAIDIVQGRDYFFAGDTSLFLDEFACNFHFKPARTLFRFHSTDKINRLQINEHGFSFGSLHIVMVNGALTSSISPTKQTIDLLLISKNAKLKLSELVRSFIIKQVIVDGSAAEWKVNKWKKDCDSLAIPCHDLAVKGAFVMNLR